MSEKGKPTCRRWTQWIRGKVTLQNWHLRQHYGLSPDGQRQTDEVRSGGSYMSQNDLRVHFGLGSATEAEMEIHWPGGLIARSKTPVNRLITIVENPTA
jgi:ASPIC and UnbV